MNWMNDETRLAANHKLITMSLYTPKSLKDLSGPLTINKTNPIQTVLDWEYLKEIRNFSYLNDTFDKEDEEFARVNKNNPAPHYMAQMNKLCEYQNVDLKIIIIQLPYLFFVIFIIDISIEAAHMYFENRRSDYMNYVALGSMIARQIALNFHHEWFRSEEKYIKRVNCFRNHFLNRGNIQKEQVRTNIFQ